MAATTADVLSYIRQHWDDSVVIDSDGSGFQGIDLPHPYTTPCAKSAGKFSFFCYWDAYFTNIGLLKQDRYDVAKANILNMMWLIRRHGFMPNHVGLDHRSQAPYFGLMVRDYLGSIHDLVDPTSLNGGTAGPYAPTTHGEGAPLPPSSRERKYPRSTNKLMDTPRAFREEAADFVRQEYFFWREARSTPTGLARCGQSATYDYIELFYDRFLVRRLGLSPDVPVDEKRYVSAHRIAECETGWDFTERFDGRAMDHAPVEFNANLYAYEVVLGQLARQLGWDEPEIWDERAKARHDRVDRYLWDEKKGLYLDYDVPGDARSRVAAATTFQPLFVGMASQEQATRVAENLALFEREYGLAVTQETETCRSYQWAYPNMWPPIVWVAVEGLARYGFHDDAGRIAGKYCAAQETLFEKTGQLWEKIDVETGDPAGGEYEAQPMIGWSAGVYVACAEYLESRPA